MKPKILNLLSDERMGGVKTSLNSLMNSRLQEKFEFAIAPLNRARASIKNLQPEIIIVHDACSWKILPSLLALKFLKGKAKLVILDHHYSESFERLKVANPQRFRLMLKLCHWCCDRLLLVSHAQGLWMRKYKLLMLRRRRKRFQGLPFQVRLLQSLNIQFGFESKMIELRIEFENLQFHISPQSCEEMIGLTVNSSGRRFR